MYRIIGADGKEYGPISADQLRQWIAENRANAATHVFAEGATEWKPLGSIPEFYPPSPSAAAATPGTIQPVPSPGIYPPAAQFPRSNNFAIIGLILGVLAVTLGLCCCYGLPFSVPGMVFSIIGFSQINGQPNRYSGKGVAIAGMILCGLSLLLALVLMLVVGISSGFDQLTHHGQKL